MTHDTAFRNLAQYVETMLPIIERAIDAYPEDFTPEEKREANDLRWALLDVHAAAG